MSSIRLENIDMVYPNGQVAARGINLEVADGEFVVLVGPSGSGKTTLLRIIAGLESPTGGRVWLADRDVTHLPPHQRDLAMVFQSYALYPHKTVRDNLGFGLRLRRVRRETIVERVAKISKTLRLEDLLDRRPGELSGGEKQRVAVGKAIVRDAQAFLFDEPLSNLDPQLREQARMELTRLHQQLGATMLSVTHDQKEAMMLGNRVGVLRDGRLEQVAAPMDLYQRPANAFVAGFIGSPSMNFFQAFFHHEDGKVFLDTPWCVLVLPSSLPSPSLPITSGKAELLIGIRPHDLLMANSGEADVVARVDRLQPLGNEMQARLSLRGKVDITPLTIVLPAGTGVREEEQIGLQFPRNRLHFFDVQTGTRLN